MYHKKVDFKVVLLDFKVVLFWCILQAIEKGASTAIIGVIIGASPLTVVVVSPILGYLVCIQYNPIGE